MSVFKMNKATNKGLRKAKCLGYDADLTKDSKPESVSLPIMGPLATDNAHKLLKGGVPKGILLVVAKGEHPDFDAFINKTPFFRGSKKQELKKIALKEYGHLYHRSTEHIVVTVDEKMKVDAERTLRKTARDLRNQRESEKKHAAKIQEQREMYFASHPKAAKKILAREQRAADRAAMLDEQDKNLFEQEIRKEHIGVFLGAKSHRTIGGISIK